MPINATFRADFSSFTNAVEKAQVDLRSFETGAGKVSTSLTRMSNSLSGTSIVQQASLMAEAVDRVGGVSTLTSKELARVGTVAQEAAEKLKALGQDVPPGIQKIADAMKKPQEEATKLQASLEQAFTNPLGAAKSFASSLASDVVPAMGSVGVAVGAAGALIGVAGVELLKLGNEAEAVGAQIGRMGTQFNIPVQNVSDLRFAVKAAGGDFDTFGDSMFTFQKRIEDNGDAVGKGLQKIGLSLESVKNLRPDEQFLAISDAIRSSGDAVNKSAVAFEIFGKQGRDILPLLLKPLSDLADESERLGNTWQDRDVNAARAFRSEVTKMAAETEEAWTSLGRTVAPITNEITLAWDRTKLAFANAVVLIATSGDSLLNFVGISKDWALASETAAAKQDTINRAIAEGAPATIKYGEAIRFVNEQFERMKPEQDQANDAAQVWLKKLGDGILAANRAADADEKLTQGLAEQGIVRGAGIDAINEYTAAQKKATAEALRQSQTLDDTTTINATVETSFQDLTFKVDNFGSALDDANKSARAYLSGSRDEIQAAADNWDNLTSSVNEFHDGITVAGDEIKTVMIPAFAKLPNVVAQATKAIEDASEAIGPGFTKRADEMLGAMESILHGVHSKFAELADVAVKTTKAVIDRLASGDLIGAAVAAITGAVTFITKLFHDVEEQVNPVRQAFVDAAGGLDALNKSAHAAGVTLTALLNAKTPEAYTKAINDLNDAFKFQDDAMKTLDDTVQKYGFSIQELGPAFAAQKLSEQAGQLLQDYVVLTAAGVDHVAIINKMGPALNEYVKQSILAGTAIPSSLKPVLQSMVDLGDLTDENGDKLTDLSKLTFSETLDAKFSTLIDTINKLADAISRGLGTAINNLPTRKEIEIVTVYSDIDNRTGGGGDTAYAAHGGIVTTGGIQYLGSGGKVRHFGPGGAVSLANQERIS